MNNDHVLSINKMCDVCPGDVYYIPGIMFNVVLSTIPSKDETVLVTVYDIQFNTINQWRSFEHDPAQLFYRL